MNEQSLQAKAVLAQNLKAYRIFFKMSQLEMAKHVHMSYRGYGKLERMEVAASLDTLDKIADYLGLSPAMLLCQDMIRFLADVAPKKKRKRSKDAEEHEEQVKFEETFDGNEELTPFEADVDSWEMMVQLEADIDSVESLQFEKDVDDSEA
ncbi:MAG: helix-turn-helix domain-containing protein [Peptococcaceae bacterium]|nr:helix-turn-helix domain-containing protein [Peptococcaceae bacterium]